MGLSTDPLFHTGWSVAIAFIVACTLRRLFGRTNKNTDMPMGGGNHGFKWHIDYRLVLVGSLLPDLIDRPLSMWLLPEGLNLSTRIFAHSLLFQAILLLLAVAVIFTTRYIGPVAFALASAGHLLFDRIWENPKTALWPLYGLQFSRAEFNNSPSWLHWLQSGTGPLILDLAGGVILLLFLLVLLRRRSLFQWIKTGVH